MSDDSVISVVAIACVFGAPMLWGIVDSMASNWRKAKIAEAEAGLKRVMVEHGYPADEIARVIAASGKAAKDAKDAVPAGKL